MNIMAFGTNETELIKFKDKEILLVGTAHISKQSIELVEQQFKEFDPDVVALELDAERLEKLVHPNRWQKMNVVELIRQGKTYLLLLNLLLASFQKKIGSKLKITPGSEMLKGFELAQKNKRHVALIDMPVKISLRKAVNEMKFMEKMKFFYFALLSVFGQGFEDIDETKIESLKDKNVLDQLLLELGNKFPSLKRVLVDDRNAFLGSSLRDIQGKKIMAIIGYGHMHAVKDIINSGGVIDRNELIKIKKGSSITKILKFLIPATIIILFIALFNFKGLSTFIDALILWLFVTVIFSAAAAFIAGSHWKTIIASGLAAPFTSLHPFIAVGWVAAMVEARERPPKVSDFEAMQELKSFKDFNKNALTHLLIVAAYTNIGSTVATFVVLPFIISMLA